MQTLRAVAAGPASLDYARRRQALLGFLSVAAIALTVHYAFVLSLPLGTILALDFAILMCIAAVAHLGPVPSRYVSFCGVLLAVTGIGVVARSLNPAFEISFTYARFDLSEAAYFQALAIAGIATGVALATYLVWSTAPRRGSIRAASGGRWVALSPVAQRRALILFGFATLTVRAVGQFTVGIGQTRHVAVIPLTGVLNYIGSLGPLIAIAGLGFIGRYRRDHTALMLAVVFAAASGLLGGLGGSRGAPIRAVGVLAAGAVMGSARLRRRTVLVIVGGLLVAISLFSTISAWRGSTTVATDSVWSGIVQASLRTGGVSYLAPVVEREISAPASELLFDFSPVIRREIVGLPREVRVGFATTIWGTAWIVARLPAVVAVAMAFGVAAALGDGRLRRERGDAVRAGAYVVLTLIMFTLIQEGNVEAHANMLVAVTGMYLGLRLFARMIPGGRFAWIPSSAARTADAPRQEEPALTG